MFRCPACRAPLSNTQVATGGACAACGTVVSRVEGVPLLVKDRAALDSAISRAKAAGREAWYTAPQLGQWQGPYRHHIQKRRSYVESVLAAYIHDSGRKDCIGLDLGCGDGANLTWLRPHFQDFYGSDYNLLRLLRASQLPDAPFLFLADINDYPTDDDSFDVIFFNHVLEHIPDDTAALREVYRILRPGGLLVLGVPNEGAAFWQLAYRLQPGVRRSSDHLHHYTAESISAKCTAAGFQLKAVHPIGWGVPHWTLDALIRRFKWIDDGLEAVGRRLLPSQATSLYVLLGK